MLLLNQYVIKNETIGGFEKNDWEWSAKSIGIMIGIGVEGFMALSLNVIGYQYADATKVGWYVTFLNMSMEIQIHSMDLRGFYTGWNI